MMVKGIQTIVTDVEQGVTLHSPPQNRTNNNNEDDSHSSPPLKTGKSTYHDDDNDDERSNTTSSRQSQNSSSNTNITNPTRGRRLRAVVKSPLTFLRHKKRKSTKSETSKTSSSPITTTTTTTPEVHVVSPSERTPLLVVETKSDSTTLPVVREAAAGQPDVHNNVLFTTPSHTNENETTHQEDYLLKHRVSFATPVDDTNHRGRLAWSKVRDHLAQGDFLLYGAFQGKQQEQQQDEDNLNFLGGGGGEKPHREVLVQEAIDEFRSGMQFSIVHCFIAIFIYFVVSIVCYNFFFEPDWSIVDSCYFAVTTFTTVGYGDITPTSDASMIFTCMYALTGVVCLGIALGILGANLVDAQEKAVSKAEQESKKELLRAFSQSTAEVGGGSDGIDEDDDSISQRITMKHQRRSTLKHSEQSDTTTMGFVQNLVLRFAPLLILQVILASYIGYQAGWDLSKTFYYLIITACTVGYGDLAPTSQSEKLVAIIFIPLAVASMGQWLSMVANFIMEGRSVRHRRKIQRRELTQRDLDIMDADGDGQVTRAEFLEFMLVAMNKIDEDLVDELRRHFDRLDVDGTGELSHDDLVEGARRNIKTVRYKLKLAAYKDRLLDQGSSGGNDEEKEGTFWGDMMGRSGFLRALSARHHHNNQGGKHRFEI